VRNHYVTLELMQDATEREITYAYRRLARKLHPDLHPDDPAGVERFRAVQEAYDVLKDPTARVRHDKALIADGVLPPEPELQGPWRAPPQKAPWRPPPRRVAAPSPYKRRWWEPPLYGVVAFLLGSLVTLAIVGWDVFNSIGSVVTGIVFIGTLLVVLFDLLRSVLTRR
jgi:hypothetical protein